MRTRAVVLTILLALPGALAAQRIPLPRIGRRPTPQPAPLPPEAPPVAKALAYHRSRWSTEGYGMVSMLQVPDATSGALMTYTTMGTGTHADYRYRDHFSATLDLTLSPIGSPAVAGTFEAGSRYSPLPFDSEVRPYFDVRAGYVYLYDTFSSSYYGGGNTPLYSDFGRYSRGFGGLVGTGFEYTLTNSLALTTGISAMRSRMTTYRLTGPGSLPAGSSFFSTTYRYTLGFKYNRVTALHMEQKPR